MMVQLGNVLFRYRNIIFPIALVSLLFEGQRIFADDLLAALIGGSVALAGMSLRALTIGLAYVIRGGRNRKVYAETLVQEGMFAHCRNPLYLGNIVFILGAGIAANSFYFVVIGVPFFLFCYLAIIQAEENFLRQKFGQDYIEYCDHVNRLIPNLSGLCQVLKGMEFKWPRLIVKEYGSIALAGGIIVLVLKNLLIHDGYQADRKMIWILTGLLLCLTVIYAVARYLKKSQRLQGD
ncbi:MAG: methyltransferase family protein [Candidatus Methylomirabilales bacterium]